MTKLEEQLQGQVEFLKANRQKLFDKCINLIAVLKIELEDPAKIPMAQKQQILDLTTESIKLNQMSYEIQFELGKYIDEGGTDEQA